MKSFKNYVLVALVLSSFSSLAAPRAQVLLMRGNVTKLAPNTTKATLVKKGEWLAEDTSLVTSDKSFVKIKFEDRSTMNLGPNSKVVINKMPVKEANMVNLLTGIIKAEVKKKSPKESKNKMLVKTRSAVMGVRGTKFQSTYNPRNKRTALVTIEGKVAMAKQDVKPIEQANVQAKDLEIILEESDSTVEVEAGRFSGVGEEKVASNIVTKPTVPVKISPEQYNAIAKTMDSNSKASDVMAQKDSDIDPEGFSNLSEGVVAPKAGGYVDFNSGLYIAPLKESIFDAQTGTYTAEKVGTVDQASGDYIPPKGVIVDEKKGLVIDQKELAQVASVEDQRSIAAAVAQVNKEVEKQGVQVNQIQNKPKTKSQSGWLPKDHLVSVEFIPFSESLEVKNKKSSSKANFYSESASWVKLGWKQVWSEKIFSSATLGFLNYEVKRDDFKLNLDDENTDDKLVSFKLGYNYSQNLSFIAGVNFRDEYYVVPLENNGTGQTVGARSFGMSYLSLGAEYALIQWSTFQIDLGGELNFGDADAPSFNGNEENGDLFGFGVELSGHYGFNNKLGIDTLLRFETRDVETEDFNFERNSLGLGVNLIYDI